MHLNQLNSLPSAEMYVYLFDYIAISVYYLQFNSRPPGLIVPPPPTLTCHGWLVNKASENFLWPILDFYPSHLAQRILGHLII